MTTQVSPWCRCTAPVCTCACARGVVDRAERRDRCRVSTMRTGLARAAQRQVGRPAGPRGPEPAPRPPPEDAAGDERVEQRRASAARRRDVGLGERQLGGSRARGAAPSTCGLSGSTTVASTAPAEDRLGVVHDEGVERVVGGDEHGERRVPGRPARPACCHSDGSVPGQPASSTASRPLTSTPSSSAFVAASPSSSSPRSARSSSRRSSGR